MKKPTYAKHLQLYAWAGKYVYGKDVVDIGCGEGYGLQVMSVFAKSVVGIDISPRFTKIARGNKYHCQSNIIEGDLEKSTSFLRSISEGTVVTAFEILEHVGYPNKVLEDICHLPLIASVPHDYPHPLHLTNYASPEDVFALFSPHYKQVDILFWTEGSFHTVAEKQCERYVVICTPKQ